MILENIYELVQYGKGCGLIVPADEIYVTNRLLELFGLYAFTYDQNWKLRSRPVQDILDDMTEYAYQQGIIEDDSITTRDLFDTKIMGCLTPMPSAVQARFKQLYAENTQKSTDFFYEFSQSTNYIRSQRIQKDEKWTVDSEYGTIDITINLSKPEKDPRDIAKAGKVQQSGYPGCLLCKENEGYAGHISHPARQNHRIIPIMLKEEQYHMQYSPYVYYNEHCIIFNDNHIPMKINKAVFEKLLDFVRQFPHYMLGSNADLPIVGGSILSHDHFQGGRYEFAMERAPYEEEFILNKYPQVCAGIVKWPMSVIRLRSKDIQSLADAANFILTAWRGYTDDQAFIFSQTEGIPHNTITPIARMKEGEYELDLVLRNNITTKESPWGVYHPSEDLHHIKKENIGLIEVMGLAVLPSRLKKEMQILEQAIVEKRDLRSMAEIEKHAEWAETWIKEYDINESNIHEIVQKEIGKVFVRVLECAGVYKRNEEGRKAFRRFITYLNNWEIS